MANCCLIFSAFVAILIAIIFGLYFNSIIPEGLPADQERGLRMCGLCFQIFGFLSHTASLFGIGDSPIENEKWIHKWLPNKVDDPEKFLEIQDDMIANIPVRIYKPKHLLSDAGKKSTGVVYLHGGGWTIGSVDMYHPLTYRLAKEANVVLISVEYRLAPKHTFPAQFHDCYAVVKTLLATGDKYGIDTNRLVVAGDSAGGNLATAVALKLRDEGKRLAAQVLVYPVLQFMDFSLPSFKKQSTTFLTTHKVAECWSYYMTGTPVMASSFLAHNHSMHLRNTKYSSYIGIEDKGKRQPQIKPLDGIPKVVLDALTDYRASPLMADNVKGLPKTLLLTCEFDILKDEAVLYKARLQDAGVKVTHYNYMTYHAFLMVQKDPLFVTEEFNQAFRDIVDYLKEL
ncbi:arylacetamide deacetylase-like [Oculina patagonica]